MGSRCLALVAYLARTLSARTDFTPIAGLSLFLVSTTGGVLMLFRLGASEICGFNEAVEALVMQQMVVQGHGLFPLLNGESPIYKPPLFHWTGVAIAHLLGMAEVSELTVRLPSVAFALAGLVLTMTFVRRRLGAHAALLSGLILLASYQYVGQARVGLVNMTLTFFETLVLLAYLSWISRTTDPEHRRPAEWRHFLMALACGLAVLAKGPVGALLPLTAIGITLAWERQWKVARALLAPGPTLVFLSVGASWYLACLLGHQNTLLDRQLVSENWARFTGALGTMSPWYYLKPVLLNSAPVSLLVPAAVVAALRRSPSPALNDRAFPRLLATFWIVTIVFFSVAAYKRRTYLLPLWPSASILLVWWLDTRTHHRGGRLLRGAVTVTCVASIAINAVFIPLAEVAGCPPTRYRAAAATITQLVPGSAALYNAGLGVGDLAALLFYLNRNVPTLNGQLGDTPPGYVILDHETWQQRGSHLEGLDEVLTVTAGNRALTLLHRGQGPVGIARSSRERTPAPLPPKTETIEGR
jgi:4-amino-4-deoxy-L-arabinose transferase-like glycosyltransferase